jgi:hypothetical protein
MTKRRAVARYQSNLFDSVRIMFLPNPIGIAAPANATGVTTIGGPTDVKGNGGIGGDEHPTVYEEIDGTTGGISPSVNGDGDDDATTMSASNLLPILAHGFFERARGGGGGSADAVASATTTKTHSPAPSAADMLQYRFWHRIISPAVERLEYFIFRDRGEEEGGRECAPSHNPTSAERRRRRRLDTSLIGAISETLGLVLEYDVYSPSYDDPNGRYFAFLERVTKVLLRCVDDYAEMGGDKNDDVDDEYNDVPLLLLASLHRLLLLNHRLFHDRLADAIAFAWSCLVQSPPFLSSSSPSETNPMRILKVKDGAIDFLSAIVKTYRELRQVGYFLSCVRGASKVSRSVLTNDVLQLLKHRLSMAYQTDLPSGQLCHVWDFFDEWIVENVVIGISADVRQKYPSDEPKKHLQQPGEEGKGEEINSTAVSELSLAVEMFIMFIKSIRANKQNCIELCSLCERSMSNSVIKLLGASDIIMTHVIRVVDGDCDRGQQRMGLDLCGWLVDLHTRSCFWIDSADNEAIDSCSRGRNITFLLPGAHGEIDTNDSDKDVDANGLNVLLEYLRDVAKTTLSTRLCKVWRKGTWLDDYWRSTDTAPTTGMSGSNCEFNPEEKFPPQPLCGSLQRMALHRIHQLHSMIYYSNLQENSDDRHAANDNDDDDLMSRNEAGNYSSTQALVDEARMLVDFSMYIASYSLFMMVRFNATIDQSSAYESLWASVAHSLCIWIHYSDPFHAEVFVIWFFTSLSHSHNDVDELTPMHVARLETSIALALARDVSFYDVNEVMSLFMRVGIQVAIKQFLGQITAITPGASRLPVLWKIYPESKRCDGAFASISGIELTSKLEDAKLAHDYDVDMASRTLAFLASAPIEIAICKENLDLLDTILGFDILSSHVVINHTKNDSQRLSSSSHLLNIIRSNKIIISNLLPRILLTSYDLDATCLKKMIGHLIRDCHIFRSDEDVVISSCNAICEYFFMCIDYYEKNDSMLVDLLARLSSVVHDAGFDFTPKAIITRSVIRRMNTFYRHHSSSKKISTACSNSPFGLFSRFVLDTLKHLHCSVVHHLSNAGDGQKQNEHVAATALILEAEALSLVGNISGYVRLERHEDRSVFENAQQLIDLITNGRRSQRSLEFIHALNYFLSIMATTQNYFLQIIPPPMLLKEILEASAQSFARGQVTPLMDAALCSLIRDSSGLELTKTTIHHVLSESPDCDNRLDPAFITKTFHLLITCTYGHEQQKYIASKCKRFLLISIGLLRDRLCSTAQLASNVSLFSMTMTTLISKKELLLLSGREIAMICSEMNSLLISDGANVHDDAKEGSTIFSCSCSVVSSLIAHYPKQLYGCPSCLFGFLLALLSHILQTNSRRGLSQKALEYAK